MDLTALLLSRLQFAYTVSFHIIFPSFTIGLAAWLTVLEALHQWTGRPVYRVVFEFWLKIFGVAFGLGVVSGVVIAFQFGTNWSVLARMSGPIQGPLLSYETFTAFFLEASFFGILLFGRPRVPPWFYLFSTAMSDERLLSGPTVSFTKEYTMSRPPLPPFTAETAIQKARLAEDLWNTRDPARVALAYSIDSRWRNRAEFLEGREAIEAFLTRKWRRELDYRLIKEVWTFHGNRIAVRFAYECHDDSGNWFRSYGNENWEFDEEGLTRLRIASINDLPIKENERRYHWPLGRRPDDHPSLSDLGL